MRCIECASEAVTERPERTAQGYMRFRCRGQKVHVIDMNDRSPHKDALNPLDIARMLGDVLIAVSRSIAANIVSRPKEITRDFFWVDWAETMLTAGISYLLHHRPDECFISKQHG